MSEVKTIVCNICGNAMKEHRQPELHDARALGLFFSWPDDWDVCPDCERNLWLALGRERGWRVSRERAAQVSSGAAEPPVAPEPNRRKRAQRAGEHASGDGAASQSGEPQPDTQKPAPEFAPKASGS